MEFNCTLTHKNIKKIMHKQKRKKALFAVIILTIIYVILFYKFIIYNFLLMSIIYILLILLLLITIFITNTIFINIYVSKTLKEDLKVHYQFTDKSIIENKQELLFKDIKKIKIYNSSFIIQSKKAQLTFTKNIFDNERDFIKAKEFILKQKRRIL